MPSRNITRLQQAEAVIGADEKSKFLLRHRIRHRKWFALSMGIVGISILASALVIGMSPNAADRFPLALNATFQGTRLDTSTWHTCYPAVSPSGGCTSFGNSQEEEWYIAPQDIVSGGSLHLVATRAPTHGIKFNWEPKTYSYASGMVTSHFDFTYGYLQVRARIPGGAGTWPGLWLLPANSQSAPEIDIMENHGSSDQIYTTLHWMTPTGEQGAYGGAWSQTNLTRGWHTYGLLWQPGSLTWYLDGKSVYTYKGSAVPDQPMYFIANLAIDGPARSGSSFDIESVRIRSHQFSATGTYS